MLYTKGNFGKMRLVHVLMEIKSKTLIYCNTWILQVF